ncbi:MAG: PIN domain-containing protein [Opitutaceae bacterium]|jgi:PIN domain nuclease of toxin-antitoxin system|nr:PIN domain-containing protein [Opitutaceae bacterium]
MSWCGRPDSNTRNWGGRARRIVGEHLGESAICDATLQEIGLLLHSDKIEFGGRPASGVLAPFLETLEVLPITLETAILAPALPLPHGDQFDRIITAVAKTRNLILITKDDNITDSDIVPVVW